MWLGYIADVSGHGVGSGVLMGMFKSGMRMRVRTGGSMASLLDDVHAVLMRLKQPQMFVTSRACPSSMGSKVIQRGHLEGQTRWNAPLPDISRSCAFATAASRK